MGKIIIKSKKLFRKVSTVKNMSLKRNILSLITAVVLSGVMTSGAAVADAIDYGDEWKNADHEAPPKYAEEWGGLSEPDSVKTISSPFSDVSSSHWAYKNIEQCRTANWMSGYDDGTFRPDENITRAEVAKVFVTLAGLKLTSAESSFSDVAASAWYAPYVEAGKTLFPIREELQGAGKFAPEVPITREDMIYVMVNALNFDRYLTSPNYALLFKFNDGEDVSSDIQAYMAVALQYGLISGYEDNTLKPSNLLTRAEFAALLCRSKAV